MGGVAGAEPASAGAELEMLLRGTEGRSSPQHSRLVPCPVQPPLPSSLSLCLSVPLAHRCRPPRSASVTSARSLDQHPHGASSRRASFVSFSDKVGLTTPSRTKWTRRVLPPVLSGHVSGPNHPLRLRHARQTLAPHAQSTPARIPQSGGVDVHPSKGWEISHPVRLVRGEGRGVSD